MSLAGNGKKKTGKNEPIVTFKGAGNLEPPEVKEKEETDLAAAIKAKLGPAAKPVKKHQISAWIEPDVWKAYNKYKGNGEKGQKSVLVNDLLKIYFGIED